jgi:hypothetical protein
MKEPGPGSASTGGGLRWIWLCLALTVGLLVAAVMTGRGPRAAHPLAAAAPEPSAAGRWGPHLRNELPDQAWEILDKAEYFELLSLNPRWERQPPKANFYGYRVLGKAEVTDAGIRKQLLSELKRGVLENQGAIAACFNPRHGIHATYKGKQADLVICFECLQIQLNGVATGEFLVTDKPKALFDKTLQGLGITLADR